MSEIKALLFDLGGVLIDFRGLAEIGAYMPGNPTVEDVRQRWIQSPALGRFERGRISPGDFGDQFVDEWQLRIDAPSFLTLFKAWIAGPLPGADALLAQLRPHFTLACLSNTNVMHWDLILVDHGLGRHLHRTYGSHLMGHMKPDPEAFQVVCDDMGLDPDQIAFFDDIEANISAARAFGLDAHLVDGPRRIEQVLTGRGLTPPA